jgi:two-component system cell cycle sensor histidine kinase/response regulator CckA
MAGSDPLKREHASLSGHKRTQMRRAIPVDGVIRLDARGKILDCDEVSEQIFRCSHHPIVGNHLHKTFLWGSVEFRNFLEEHSNRIPSAAQSLETTFVRPDGSRLLCKLTVVESTAERDSLTLQVRDISTTKALDEAWLAAIVESSREAIIGIDLKGKVVSWNRGAAEIWNYTEEEIVGKDSSLLIPTAQASGFSTLVNSVKSGHPIPCLETFAATKNGSRIIVSLTLSPVYDATERTIGVSAVVRDITTTKVAHAALRKASDTTIQSSPIPVIAADRKNLVTTWNRAATATFGWSEHEVIGKPLPIIPPEEIKRAHELHRRLLAGETLTGIEVQRRKRDGTLLTVSLSAAPVWDEHHQVKGIIGFLTDITEWKRSEEALRRTEEKYRSIFENAVEGIYQATLSGKYLSANPALARMFGYDWPEDLITARDDIGRQEYADPRLRLEFIRLIEQQGIVKDFVYEARKRDGKPVWLSASARAVRASDGHPLYFEGTVKDITERRELEIQLRQMQKIEAIGRLAGGVAHDFNNILMAISSYSELLAKKTRDESLHPYLEEITKAADRGASLTRALLTFSRKQTSSPVLLNLNSVISDQLGMLRRLIPENIEVKFLPDESILSVKADPTHMEQVVMNLVINARDAMPDGGSVTIETGMTSSEQARDLGLLNPRTEYVYLYVKDTGCGMTEETKSHIFEPFFTTKEQGKGTGLGLATVLGAVQQNMGQITIESQLAKGTIFKIYLPSVEGSAPEVQRCGPIEIRANGETILLVEDELSVRNATADFLLDCGYRVLAAGSGNEALRIAERHDGSIDVLLTDLVMPGMSGIALADEIVKRKAETVVIFMSGYSNDVLSEQRLHGEHLLLQKPLRLRIMGERIRGALAHRKKASTKP